MRDKKDEIRVQYDFTIDFYPQNIRMNDMTNKKYTGNPENPAGTVSSLISHITMSREAEDWDEWYERVARLVTRFKRVKGEWKTTPEGRKHFKPAKTAKPTQIVEIRHESKKKKDKKPVNYNNPMKRKSRKFVAQDFDGNIPKDAVKKALIMPGEDLHGIAQFFEMGVFDENTQMICVESDKKIFDKWQHNNGRGFGYRLRTAIETQGVRGIAAVEAAEHRKPTLLHGEIGGKRKDGEWKIDLADIDGIDFVWLDFKGIVLPRYLDWIQEVLRSKLNIYATVSVTAMSTAHTWQTATCDNARKKQAMIDKMDSDGRIPYEILEQLDDELGEERGGQLETFRSDNILIADALTFDDRDVDGFWARRSNDDHLHAKPLGDYDILLHKGEDCYQQMATHKFYHGAKCEVWDIVL